jgi:hypothetical protein
MVGLTAGFRCVHGIGLNLYHSAPAVFPQMTAELVVLDHYGQNLVPFRLAILLPHP